MEIAAFLAAHVKANARLAQLALMMMGSVSLTLMLASTAVAVQQLARLIVLMLNNFSWASQGAA